jgi:type IV pilus assembly protein PilW
LIMINARPNAVAKARQGFGFSLIEIMIALALASFLILGIVQVFVASKAAYMASDGLSRVQESARFATDYLQHDIRMAGHMGCVSDSARFFDPTSRSMVFNHLLTVGLPMTEAPYAYRSDFAIEGYEATGTAPSDTLDLTATTPVVATGGGSWTPNIPAIAPDSTTMIATGLAQLFAPGTGQALVGSDIVVLRFFGTASLPVASIDVAGSTITYNATAAPTAAFLRDFLTNGGGDVYGVSDCTRASLIRITGNPVGTTLPTAFNGAGIQNVTGWSNGNEVYTVGSFIHRFETLVYYVGVGASGQPSLFRLRPRAYTVNLGNAFREELVEGVENIQLIYAWDNIAAPNLPDGQMNAEGTADTVWTLPGATNADRWRAVGAVRIGLLVRSPERSAAKGRQASVAATNQFTVNGVLVNAANDERVRQVYLTTATLRNRLFGN